MTTAKDFLPLKLEVQTTGKSIEIEGMELLSYLTLARYGLKNCNQEVVCVQEQKLKELTIFLLEQIPKLGSSEKVYYLDHLTKREEPTVKE